MLPMLRRRARAETGFTLIELLVVILIIGLLAAIAIPSFLNQRTKANDAGAKVVARTAQTAEETAFTDRQVYVSQAVAAGAAGALNAIEGTLTAASPACVGSPPYSVSPCGLSATGTSATYSIAVTSESGIVFRLARDILGNVTRTCDVTAATSGAGGCAMVVANTGSW